VAVCKVGCMTDPYTFWVAFYAAVVATAVAAWDVAKWKLQGPRLSVSIQPGMKLVGGWGKREERTFISVRVVNRGDRPTTITNLTYALYDNDWQAFANKMNVKYAAVIVDQSEAQPIPYVLSPGEQWSGLAWQDADVERMAREGCLMLRVHHTHSNTPISNQVRLRATSPAD